MSDEGRVMSSETTFQVVPVMDNTLTGQRDSGCSAVSSKPCAARHRTGEVAWCIGTRMRVNRMTSGVCELALKPQVVERRPVSSEEPRPKPDSGNPTVRDCREAYGNVN
jgi:hypothetical protein